MPISQNARKVLLLTFIFMGLPLHSLAIDGSRDAIEVKAIEFIAAYIDSFPSEYGPIARFIAHKSPDIIYKYYNSNRVPTELFEAMNNTFDTLKAKPWLLHFTGKSKYEVYSPARMLKENKREHPDDLCLEIHAQNYHKGHNYIAIQITCCQDHTKNSARMFLDIYKNKVVNYYYKVRLKG